MEIEPLLKYVLDLLTFVCLANSVFMSPRLFISAVELKKNNKTKKIKKNKALWILRWMLWKHLQALSLLLFTVFASPVVPGWMRETRPRRSH